MMDLAIKMKQEREYLKSLKELKEKLIAKGRTLQCKTVSSLIEQHTTNIERLRKLYIKKQ